MALVSQLADSVNLTTLAGAPLTASEQTAGRANSALALLTRYFPTELIGPYAAITAVLPAIEPSSDTVTESAEKRPPVAPAEIPVCEYNYDGRLWWFIGFAVLALVAVPLLNATRTQSANWRMVCIIDAPIAFIAFILWGLALPKSPIESVCGDQVSAIQIACGVLGAFLIPTVALALKNTVGKRWWQPPPPPSG